MLLPYLMYCEIDIIDVLTPGLEFGKRLDVASDSFCEGPHVFLSRLVDCVLKLSHIGVGLRRVSL
jgi:hypothetical protein